MTDNRLDEIAARHAASTPGEWKNWGGTATHAVNAGLKRIIGCDIDVIDPRVEPPGFAGESWRADICKCEDGSVSARAGILSYTDAEFIAHAHQDVPLLLDLVITQRAEIERLTSLLSEAEARGRIAGLEEAIGRIQHWFYASNKDARACIEEIRVLSAGSATE